MLVGKANDEACRWWQAVLAKGQGYKAEVVAGAKGAFLAPFSIDVKYEFTIGRNRGRGTPMQPFKPPPPIRRPSHRLHHFYEYHHATTEFTTAMSIAFMVFMVFMVSVETTHPPNPNQRAPKARRPIHFLQSTPPPLPDHVL